jgi:hypothetical protein
MENQMKKATTMGIFISMVAMLGFAAKTEPKEWFIAAGEDNGFPLIMRARNQVPNGVRTKDYSHSITIAWKYQPNENGMPGEKENQEMESLENATEKLIENKKIGYLAVVFTGNGNREWHWYARDEKEFVESINGYLVGKRKIPIEISDEIDPEWKEWKQFVELSKSKNN